VTLIGDVFIFLGQVFICAVTVLIGYVIITKAPYYEGRIYSPIMPCIAFFIISYIIGELFMMVYG